MILNCNQELCRWCYKDTRVPGAPLVCTHPSPQLIPHHELRSFMLKCHTYKYRQLGDKLQPLTIIDPKTGLYPGQIVPALS